MSIDNFQEACRNGNIKAVNDILNNPAFSKEELNKANEYNITPFGSAVLNNQYDIVKILLNDERLTTLNGPLRHGRTPLYLACECSHLDIVKLLMMHDANINVYLPTLIQPFYDDLINDLIREYHNDKIKTRNRLKKEAKELAYKAIELVYTNNFLHIVAVCDNYYMIK